MKSKQQLWRILRRELSQRHWTYVKSNFTIINSSIINKKYETIATLLGQATPQKVASDLKGHTVLEYDSSCLQECCRSQG